MVAESVAVADMAIRITTIKLIACPADRRRLNREACCRRVAVEEDSTAVAGNTAVAGIAIRITTIMLEARRADHRLQRIIKEEGKEVSRVEGACCRRVVAVEGCTAEGSTAVAVMAIHITMIKVAARRVMEEGSTVEGSTGKGEG